MLGRIARIPGAARPNMYFGVMPFEGILPGFI